MERDKVYNLYGKKWILTDFFDTLVHRTVPEKTVRKCWAGLVSEQLESKISPNLLLSIRSKATKQLVRISKTEEICLVNILEEMYVYLHSSVSIPLERFIELCVDAELFAETKHLYLDDSMIAFLRDKKKEGFRIAVVSDTFLSEDNLKRIMTCLGIDDVTNVFFVSSEYGVKKQTGNLYEVVIKDLGNAADLVMFGDNKIADYEMPLRHGIESYQLEWSDNYTCVNVKNEFRRLYVEGKKTPFSNYAFIYYLYIDRLYRRLVELNAKKVFFLAREGYFLITLFNFYQSDKARKFDAEYLYVSRKATLLASLRGAAETEFLSIFRSYKDLDIQSFLKNLSFTDDEIETVKKELDVDCSKVIYGLHHSREFQTLLKCGVFKDILDRKCIKEKELFEQYIKQQGVLTGDEIILVDVGWKGTIQDNVYYALGEKYKIRGLYLGYENCTGNESWRNIKEGLVFSKYPAPSKNYSMWDFETHLIEQMLAAPHGSTYSYRDENGMIMPILEEYSDEDKELYSLAKNVQDGITKTFIGLCDVITSNYISTDEIVPLLTLYHLKTLLLLDEKCIEFERVALTPRTNNFGWFKKIPTRTSKKEKILSMLKDLKQIKTSGLGFMSFVSYFSIKLNARHKYSWKKIAYRFVYVIERMLLEK